MGRTNSRGIAIPEEVKVKSDDIILYDGLYSRVVSMRMDSNKVVVELTAVEKAVTMSIEQLNNCRIG